MTEVIGEPKYVTIIKYLNYQKLPINNNLLESIAKVAEIKDRDSPKLAELDISMKKYRHIQKLIELFGDIPLLDNNNNKNEYYYYIFILLNLPKYMIKNLSRLYMAKLYKQYQFNASHNYFTFMISGEPLQLLLENLEEAKTRDPEYILFFIDTINLFFT